ncbi:MAG: hypothetical protein PHC88_09785 [Terrimicrobiaceae bacterium]|nr:hypothetical protein [Terrimicrobiaceae bacterium]
MKNPIRNLGGAALLGMLPLTAQFAQTQTALETVTSTASSMGTISEFSPDTVSIRSDATTPPVSYRYTKSTTYVDETGAPVSIETVRSGTPVTVYYVKDADGMVASKIIVRRAVSTPAVPIVEETKKTTTTTTTGQ